MPPKIQETESRAKLALEKYIQDVRNSIPPGSGLAGIEAAMMKHNPNFLLEVMQTLDQEQGISPSGERKLENHAKIGRRTRAVKSAWGEYQIVIQRWEEKGSKKQSSTPIDASLDGSDWTLELCQPRNLSRSWLVYCAKLEYGKKTPSLLCLMGRCG